MLLVGQHIESAATLSSKKLSVHSVDSRVINVGTIRNTDGSLFLDDSSRTLIESASQPSPSAGEGRFWVRSSDSKLIFTDDTNTNHDVTTITVNDVLQRDNDADALSLMNLASVSFSDGVELGNNANAENTDVCIGKDASCIGNGFQICIGRNAYTDATGDISIGFGATSYGLTSYKVCIGCNQTNKNSIQIGYINNAIDNSIVIGYNNFSNGTGEYGVSIGSNRVTDRSTTISHSVTFGQNEGVTIGHITKHFPKETLIGSNILSHPDNGAYVFNNVMIGRHIDNSTVWQNSNNVMINTSTNSTYGRMQNVVIGYENYCMSYCTAIGANIEIQNDYVVALGFSPKVACAEYSVIIGTNPNFTYNTSNDIFMAQQFRTFERRGSLTTSSAGPTTLMSFDLSQFNSFNTSFCIDVSVLGRNNGGGSGTLNDTHFISLKKFHFRNNAGSISFVSGNEETEIDSPDADALVQELVTTGAFATNTQGQYFFIYDGNDDGSDPSSGYFVWNDTANDQTTGSPAGSLHLLNNPVPVNTLGVTNDVDVAFRITQAIHAETEFNAVGPVRQVTEVDFAGSFTELRGTLGTPDTHNVVITVLALPTQGQYFLLHSTYDANRYFLWADTAGDGTTGKPTVTGYTELAVNLLGATTPNLVASAIATAIGTLPAHFTVTYPYANPSYDLLVTNTSAGFSSGALGGNWTIGLGNGAGRPRKQQYWFIRSALNETVYHVWYDSTGADSAPTPAPNGSTAIRVDVSGRGVTSDNDIATLTRNALNGVFANFSATVLGTVVTVTNVRAGVTTAASNGITYDPIYPARGGHMEDISFNQTVSGTNGYESDNRVVITNATSSIPGVVRSINNTTATSDPWDNISVTVTDTFSATLTLIGSAATVRVYQRSGYEIDWIGVMRVSSNTSGL